MRVLPPATLAKPFYAVIDTIRTLRLPEVPIQKRFELFGVALRAWSRRAPSNHTLHFPSGGELHFGAESLNADWNVFSEIFLSRCYGDQYSGATVLDIGAHKGYFGAFALLQGAAEVTSFEPERHNFSLLRQAAEAFSRHGYSWKVHEAAVGSQQHTATLNVSGEAWTHSLLSLPETGSRRKVQEWEVDVVPLHVWIQEGAARASRLVVKLDIEGAECDVVLNTPADAWRMVDEVFIETHPFAPCSADQIIGHLMNADLSPQDDTNRQITHLRQG